MTTTSYRKVVALEATAYRMLLTPEKLYLDLGRLMAEMPELGSGPMTPGVRDWLAGVETLVKSSGSLADALQLSVACGNLEGPLRARNAETIVNILHRVLAKAELNAPREMQGAVLLIGGDSDAYMVVRRLLSTAVNDALFVEPDAAGKVLADYAILAPERVPVRLLADEAQYKPSLIAGVRRWQQRFGDRRNLTVRLASANSLHDRLILLDGERGWALGMPFGSLAKRAHTTLIRMRPEEEARKIAVYAEIWEEALPLSPRS
jgi:hypothetical protein